MVKIKVIISILVFCFGVLVTSIVALIMAEDLDVAFIIGLLVTSIIVSIIVMTFLIMADKVDNRKFYKYLRLNNFTPNVAYEEMGVKFYLDTNAEKFACNYLVNEKVLTLDRLINFSLETYRKDSNNIIVKAVVCIKIGVGSLDNYNLTLLDCKIPHNESVFDIEKESEKNEQIFRIIKLKEKIEQIINHYHGDNKDKLYLSKDAMETYLADITPNPRYWER